MADFERAETADLDVALLLKRLFNGIEKGVDNTSAVFFRDHWPSRLSNLSRNVFDQVGFSHRFDRAGAGPPFGWLARRT